MRTKYLSVYIFLILLLIPLNFVLASCGTTYPLPSTIVLERGDVARFRFEIQNYIGGEDQIVEYNTEDITPFQMIWDYLPPQVIKAGSKLNVFATLSSSNTVDLGDYTFNINIKCSPVITGGGTTFKEESNIPLNIKVVGTSEENTKNFYVPCDKINKLNWKLCWKDVLNKNKFIVVFVAIVVITILSLLSYFIYNKLGTRRIEGAIIQ